MTGVHFHKIDFAENKIGFVGVLRNGILKMLAAMLGLKMKLESGGGGGLRVSRWGRIIIHPQVCVSVSVAQA